MIKNFLSQALCGVLLLSALGCYSIRYEVADLPHAVTLDNDSGKTSYHFIENTRNFYLLGGAWPILKPSMDSVLEEYAQRGRIKNLSIKQEMSLFDLVLRFIAFPALGLSSISVTYEGDVVKGGQR